MRYWTPFESEHSARNKRLRVILRNYLTSKHRCAICVFLLGHDSLPCSPQALRRACLPQAGLARLLCPTTYAPLFTPRNVEGVGVFRHFEGLPRLLHPTASSPPRSFLFSDL